LESGVILCKTKGWKSGATPQTKKSGVAFFLKNQAKSLKKKQKTTQNPQTIDENFFSALKS